jgi:formate/nitrite transporter FocA (FNT family)
MLASAPHNQIADLEAGVNGNVMFSVLPTDERESVETLPKIQPNADPQDSHPRLLRFLSFAPNAMKKSFDRGDDYKEIQQFSLPQDMNTMIDVEKLQEKLSVYKGQLPFPRLFFLGVLAGWWCGLAVILVVTIAGGIPAATRAAWPCLPKLAAGFFFPVAIFLIIIFGGELFTGNAMSLLIGLFARRVTVLELLYNWSVVLVSNFVGCVFTVYVFGWLTGLFEAEPFLSYAKGVAVYKIHLKPEVAFLRAIPANALVCTSVLVGQQARTMTGKLVSFLAALAVLLALARSCHCISHTVHPCSAAISLLSADAFAFLRRRACGSLS